LTRPTRGTTPAAGFGRRGRRQRADRVAETLTDELRGETQLLCQRGTERAESERLFVIRAVGTQRYTDDGQRRAFRAEPARDQRGAVVGFLPAIDRAEGQSEAAIIVGDGDADPALAGIETQNSSPGALTRWVGLDQDGPL
jgi:hypothetical protein